MLSKLLLRLRAFFRKAEVERDLDDELRFHLELEIERNRRRGLDQEEARYEALKSFGGVEQVKEECRDTRGIGLIEALLADLRFALRMFRKSPGFSFVAVLTLALGIGANTAIFSVVKGLLLRPLPYQEAERLVWVWGRNDRLGVGQGFLSGADIFDFGRQSSSVETVAAWTTLPINLVSENQSERLEGILVTTNFFETLGVRMQAGRDFLPGEAEEGRNQVVIISDGLWRRSFGANPAVVGQRIKLDRPDVNSFIIVGVAPPEVQYPQRTDVWMPDIVEPTEGERGGHDLRAVARLKPGVSVEEAQSELNIIAARLEQQYPASNAGWRVALTSVRDQVLGTPYRAVWLLLCAVGGVLLIACANVANLQFARAATRSKELAIRSALGASRARLVRQLLTESLLLAFLGGFAGLLLSQWGVGVLRSLGPATIPRLQLVQTDWTVLAFAFIVSLITGIACGLLPAWQASRTDLNETMKDAARGSNASTQSRRSRNLLVVSEVALTVVLLVCTGLLLKSFWRLLSVDTGFKADGVLTAGISLNREKYMASGERRVNFFSQVIERVRALPGVESVGAISHLPFGGRGVNQSFTLEGRPLLPGEDSTRAELRVVSPDYFRAMSIPVREGRAFTELDKGSAQKVLVVNETFARKFLDGRTALGKQLRINMREAFEGEIVGVVGDVRHRGYNEESRPEIYVSYLQNTIWPVMNLVVRTRTEPVELSEALRREIAAVDPTQAVFNVRPLADFLSDSIAERRFNLMLLVVFACLALLTAAAGIYGVTSYMVARRTREIGIRIAMGAQKRDVLKLVVGQGMSATLFGVVLGLACAYVLTRALSSLLYDVSTTDPASFMGVSLLILSVALLACYLPARRAMRVDPMIALRDD